MGVYIPNIEIPKCCDKCRIRTLNYEFKCPYKSSGLVANNNDSIKRRDGCPLVDIPVPHGRLIDASSEIEIEHGTLFEMCIGKTKKQMYTIEEVLVATQSKIIALIEPEDKT